MTLPLTVPGDPNTDLVTVSMKVPAWVYWQMVSVGETQGEEVETMMYVACRATIADFEATETIAMAKVVTRLVKAGNSDPKIAALLDIPLRRARAIRRGLGLDSTARPGRKKPEALLVA